MSRKAWGNGSVAPTKPPIAGNSHRRLRESHRDRAALKQIIRGARLDLALIFLGRKSWGKIPPQLHVHALDIIPMLKYSNKTDWQMHGWFNE